MYLDKLATFDHKTSMAAFTVAGSPFLCANSYDTAVAGGATQTVGAITQSDGAPAPFAPVGNTDQRIGGPLLHDIGRGRPVLLLVQITTAVTSGGAATVKVDFITDTDQGLATAKVVEISSPAVPKATLVAGYRFPFKTLPPKVTQQFVGVQYTVATADLTAGAVESTMMLAAMDDHADIIGAAP